jgi:flagellar basal-body rod protein FlgF
MRLEGRVAYTGDGMSLSTRGMITPMKVLNVHTDNIANFGVPGYQRKEAVPTSFIQYLGPNGVDQTVDTKVGRLRLSGNPLDMALNCQGYFQKTDTSGQIELTRDGRMKLDENGYLLSLDDKRVLSASGQPIQFSVIPTDPEKQVKVTADGTITVYDVKQGKMLPMGKLAVVSQDGSVTADIDVKQRYVEDSNVFLAQEFVSILPLRRQFEANRQLFILQSDSMSRMIQELGRTQ